MNSKSNGNGNTGPMASNPGQAPDQQQENPADVARRMADTFESDTYQRAKEVISVQRQTIDLMEVRMRNLESLLQVTARNLGTVESGIDRAIVLLADENRDTKKSLVTNVRTILDAAKVEVWKDINRQAQPGESND